MACIKLGLIYCLMSLLISILEAWAPDSQPKLHINLEQEKLPVFFGNSTDYFKVLDQDDNSILIGARNAVYNLSLNGLREIERQRIEWSSSGADREICTLKGKQEEDCQNYIRVFAKISDSQIMICGTNSYKPKCRYYTVHNTINGTKDRPFEKIDEKEAQGRCPYNPTHNSTYIFTDGQLYSATVADFSGADPLIYREPQRTEQYDSKQLNQPAFVSAVERNGYVFFFFREISMEYMNCGKAMYSRVGRVCKNDKGGPYAFSERWTSFLKTRLNCSVPGEYPFYFDEIQATSKIIDGIYSQNRSAVIYAVFTTSMNAIPGSAVCVFTVDDILQSFEGNFKSQRDINSNWLPVPNDNVPDPRPGKCVDDSRTLPSTSANFVRTHTLMESSVPSMYGRPILTRVSLDHRLTAITVDPQIVAMDGSTYDIIFAGTDDGKVIKFVNIPQSDNDSNNNNNNNNNINNNNVQTVVISEMQALPSGMPVRELTIAQKTKSIIVVGDGHIVSVPLYHCSEIRYCLECINLQDPYCVWDINNHDCRSISNIKRVAGISENYLQGLNSISAIVELCKNSVDAGNRIDQTPVVIQSTRGTVSAVGKLPSQTRDPESKITVMSVDPAGLKNMLNGDPLTRESIGLEAENLHVASNNMYWGFAGIVLILVFGIGILVGLYSSRRLCKSSPFHAEHRNQLSSKTRPFHHRNSGKDVNLLMNTNAFQSAPCNNKKDNIENEFVVGDKDRSHECKNSTENLEKEVHCKTGTLTKVKRTYI